MACFLSIRTWQEASDFLSRNFFFAKHLHGAVLKRLWTKVEALFQPVRARQRAEFRELLLMMYPFSF